MLPGDAPIGPPRGVLEHLLEVVADEGTTAVGILDGGPGGDLQRRGIDLGEVHVDRVIPEGVIERGADHFGPRRHLGLTGRVDFELVDRPCRIGSIDGAETGVKPAVLSADDGPRRAEADVAIGAANQLGDRQIADADAIGEPAGIRHVVERIHIDRPDVSPIAGTAEGVLEEVVVVVEIDLARRGDVDDPVVVDGDRIVGQEARAGAPQVRDQRERRDQRPGDRLRTHDRAPG